MHDPPDADVVAGSAAPAQVAAGEDRFGEPRRLGPNTIDYKLAPPDSNGVLLVEMTCHAQGGPERHRRLEQDEWF
jgi:hypothetical protein